MERSRVRDRVGRRGGYLLLKAVMFAGHGLLFLLWPPTPALAAALRVPLTLAPLRVWGGVWLAAAVVAAASAFRRGPGSDRWGFLALILVASFWASSYVAGAVIGTGGFARGMVAALLYSTLAGVIVIVAGWPEQPR